MPCRNPCKLLHPSCIHILRWSLVHATQACWAWRICSKSCGTHVIYHVGSPSRQWENELAKSLLGPKHTWFRVEWREASYSIDTQTILPRYEGFCHSHFPRNNWTSYEYLIITIKVKFLVLIKWSYGPPNHVDYWTSNGYYILNTQFNLF
jgi:hypothetical protein